MEFLSESFNDFLHNREEIAVVSSDNALIEKLDEAVNGQISKLKAQAGDDSEGWLVLKAPSGIDAKVLYVCDASDMRKRGGELAAQVKDEVAIWGADEEFVYGYALRNYQFDKYRKEPKSLPDAKFVVEDVESFTQACAPWLARAEGVHLTRDLVNEPANVLTTKEFAKRIKALRDLGVEVEILGEKELGRIGMRALLGVGQGSQSPSKVAIMHWNNGEGAPLALVGKGVVFDTGGISIKPSAGMEEMIMDMGGAGTVVGTMHAIAARKARANVVGIVGLVENMPDGKAQRPGDIVKTLKGDTVEVLNTDAEGRLVLADILWYVQEQYKPEYVIDLATLTGAIIIALGSHKAGIFGNDDAFVQNLLASAKAQDEGAWHMPLDEVYNKQLKSQHADMGNIGGREAGSITAAQFLQRFVKDGVKWIHIDIAGVATRKSANHFSIEGATGWGVMTLDHLVSEHFER